MRSLFVACCVAGLVGALQAESEDLAKIDKVMGNWEGEWTDEYSGGQGVCYAKLVGHGKYNYKCFFEAEVNGAINPFEFDLKPETPGEYVFKGSLPLGDDLGGDADFEYKLVDGKLVGLVENMQIKVEITLERVYNKPPTLGAEAPEGAVVLFDGSNADNFEKAGGGACPWTVADGVLHVKPGTGNIVSKEKFADHELHVEFRTPYMPAMGGQARGNSGVYVTGNIEVQVLDSFGNPPRDNEAGGIYQVATPKENASLPPGEWQAYDITYYAPKTEGGKVTKPGEITVVYNGTTIHDKVAIDTLTKGGTGGDIGQPGPLLLQDHGNLVEFKNIWAKPIPPKAE